tara:strand:+ start:2167 stop:2439 length:273 start_codon:yes stop_codon:yes gene_type:complete
LFKFACRKINIGRVIFGKYSASLCTLYPTSNLSERYEQALAGGFLLTIDWINPRPTLKPYSRFCRAGGCSQRGAAADPSLDSPSAPEHHA